MIYLSICMELFSHVSIWSISCNCKAGHINMKSICPVYCSIKVISSYWTMDKTVDLFEVQSTKTILLMTIHYNTKLRPGWIINNTTGHERSILAIYLLWFQLCGIISYDTQHLTYQYLMRFNGHSTGTVGKIMKMGATKWAILKKHY